MEYVLNNPIILRYLNDIEEEYKTLVSYVDVTSEWIMKSKPNSHIVRDLNYWIIDNKKIYVDGRNVVLDYSKTEKKCAEWLENTFGGEIYMCPRVNNPFSIRTPDYIWKKEYWDLKVIKNATSSRAIDNALKRSKGQTKNIILDINSKKLSDENVIRQSKKIFSTSKRNWINTIIIKRNNKLVGVYTRNKNEVAPHPIADWDQPH